MERRDPDPAADERISLDQFLDYELATLPGETDDLSARGMRQRIPTLALTLAGLLKHLALVEDDWIRVRCLGCPEREPWASGPMGAGPRLGVPRRRARASR